FSSRRRHTRFSRDWSSDVCSSDLRENVADCLPYLNALVQNTPSAVNIGRYAEIVRDRALRRGLIAETSKMVEMAVNPKGKTAARSEERRVGKERRARWLAGH